MKFPTSGAMVEACLGHIGTMIGHAKLSGLLELYTFHNSEFGPGDISIGSLLLGPYQGHSRPYMASVLASYQEITN